MTKTQDNPAPVLLVTLEQLSISEQNVRAHVPLDDDVHMLAASIASVGLLQPLVVTPHPTTLAAYEVVAGRRRFAALGIIRDKGVISAKDFPVAVRVIDPAQATEASLAENRARVQMNSVELYAAFKKLADEGMDLADIGRAFGYDRPRVERILRLALLHPSIMKAWADGDIDEARAVAFASTADQALQDEVATKLLERNNGKWSWIHAHEIRTAIKRSIEGDQVQPHVVKFVGIEAYEAAGGTLERDLFGDSVTIKDPALLTRLAEAKEDQCMVAEVERLSRADGGSINVEWVDAPPTINRYGYDSTDHDLSVEFEPGPLSKEAQERQAEIEDALAAYDDDLPEENRMALEEELESLLASENTVIPAGKGRVLLVGEINRHGGYSVDAFYADREAAGLPPLATSTVKTSTTGKSEAEQAKADIGASRDGFMAMQVLFADTVADRLANDASLNGSTLGLDALLFGLTRNITTTATSLGFPSTRMPERGNSKVRGLIEDLSTISDVLTFEWWAKEPDTAAAWDAYCEWIGVANNRVELGAALLARTWHPLASGFREEKRPKFVCLVAEAAFDGEGSCGVADVMPRVKALELMNHKARVALLSEWGLADHAKGLKKGTSVDFAAKVLAADSEQRKLWGIDEETGAAIDAWLPSELEVISVPRPVAEKPKAEKPKKASKPKKAKELADA